MQSTKKEKFVKFLAGWLFLSTSIVTVLTWRNPVAHAVLLMGSGLILFWIVMCGGLMYVSRNIVKIIVLKLIGSWRLKFFLFTTFLALFEEAIATKMTNLAPAFGVQTGQAYITASTNFLDVVLFHSVINFLGPFFCWTLILKRYDFSPFATFVMWGISGVIAEVAFSGPQSILQFSLWIFVYGLMIFLPTYTLPSGPERGAKIPSWYHYPIMLFLPFLFVPLFAWIPKVLDNNHPQPTHFAPIKP